MQNDLDPTPTDLLREVLDNLDSLERLEDHPWAWSRLVQEQCARQPSLKDRPAGQRLASAVVHAFQEMIPSAPPRQGKRLDTRWGEFGLLAARYFAPFLNGQRYPASLREAWHGMDAAILAFAFDGRTDATEEEKLRYRLLAKEPEVAPDSTLSDWHRKGIQRLAEDLERREKYLQSLPASKAGRSESVPSAKKNKYAGLFVKLFLLGAVLLLAAGLVLGGLKARKAYDLALVVRADAGSLKQLAASGVDLAALKNAGPALTTLRADFGLLKAEVQPFLPFTPWLEWVPVYGGDLASSGKLLEIGDLLLEGGEQSYEALGPLLSAMEQGEPLTPPQAIRLLEQAAPGLTQARANIAQAASLRSEVDAALLSPRTRGILEQYMDPLLPKLTDGLEAALALPGFMGATSSGPKTYLLLAENEDELRATGGFITSAGNLVVRNGQILSLTFQDTGTLDDWAMPYPPSPWQLEDYMNSTVLVPARFQLVHRFSGHRGNCRISLFLYLPPFGGRGDRLRPAQPGETARGAGACSGGRTGRLCGCVQCAGLHAAGQERRLQTGLRIGVIKPSSGTSPPPFSTGCIPRIPATGRRCSNTWSPSWTRDIC